MGRASMTVEVIKSQEGPVTRRLTFSADTFAEVVAGWKLAGSPGFQESDDVVTIDYIASDTGQARPVRSGTPNPNPTLPQKVPPGL